MNSQLSIAVYVSAQSPYCRGIENRLRRIGDEYAGGVEDRVSLTVRDVASKSSLEPVITFTPTVVVTNVRTTNHDTGDLQDADALRDVLTVLNQPSVRD